MARAGWLAKHSRRLLLLVGIGGWGGERRRKKAGFLRKQATGTVDTRRKAVKNQSNKFYHKPDFLVLDN
jgi:hypothetical protein